MTRILIETNVDLTLMAMDANGDYAPSSVMTFQYYIAAPPEFAENLPQNCGQLMVRIYNEHSRVFREREPNDLSYIAVAGVTPRVVDASEYPQEPWLHGKCPAWEDSNLIGLNGDDYKKLSPMFFGALVNSGL